MKILITGSNGLLGQKLLHRLRLDKDVELYATSIGKNRVSLRDGYQYFSLDITNKSDLKFIVNKVRPNVIINTAAMTNVDVCEDDNKKCEDLNINAVKYLVDISVKLNIHLIHISTDFIYDGKKGLYVEDDIANPLSFYGLSKLNILYRDDGS